MYVRPRQKSPVNRRDCLYYAIPHRIVTGKTASPFLHKFRKGDVRDELFFLNRHLDDLLDRKV